MFCVRPSSPLFASLVACALAAALAGCGDDAATGNPDGDDPAPAEPLPGDPTFVRDPALNVDNISAAGEARSHNMGLNCMGCHQQHGPGKGLFTAAGTAYKGDGTPQTGGTLELRTESEGKGDLVLSVAIDMNGNFFTTEPLPFPDQSLFPLLRSPSGDGTTMMPFPTISGACNLCHNEQKRVQLD